MHKQNKYMSLCFYLLPLALIGQINVPSKQFNKFLDSVINTSSLKHSTLIYFEPKSNDITIDTLPFIKVRALKHDSAVVIKFIDKSEKKIKATDFWGLITDYGERRRFYKGQGYIVWHTKQPYIYKVEKGNRKQYFFSLSLSNEILPLTVEQVAKLNDLNIMNYLTKFMAENPNDSKISEEVLISSSIDFAIGLYNILVPWAADMNAQNQRHKRHNK